MSKIINFQISNKLKGDQKLYLLKYLQNKTISSNIKYCSEKTFIKIIFFPNISNQNLRNK